MTTEVKELKRNIEEIENLEEIDNKKIQKILLNDDNIKIIETGKEKIKQNNINSIEQTIEFVKEEKNENKIIFMIKIIMKCNINEKIIKLERFYSGSCNIFGQGDYINKIIRNHEKEIIDDIKSLINF